MSYFDSGRQPIYKDPLPAQIRKIREESFSVFVSNLPQQISRAEIEAIFWREGRINDVFIPKDRRDNSNRGFAFVRFATLREAEKAVQIAEGRLWGGMKIQANLAQFSSKNSERRGKERSQGAWNMQSSFHAGETNTAGASEPAREQGRNNSLCSGTAGWLVEEGEGKGVRVAPWVVKEQKKSLYNSLVGFLKSKSEGIEQIESWIQ